MERRQAGFSLVEMLVALTVSLLATGAVYQLVTAGQSAFRREPALADRQQNIRVAMDVISRDVLRAGYGLPTWARVFTPSLDGVGCKVGGPACSLLGASNQQTDQLELVAAGSCASLEICKVSTVTPYLVVTKEKSTCLASPPARLLFANAKEWQLVPMTTTTDTDTCGGNNGYVAPDVGGNLTEKRFTASGTAPLWVMNGAQVRYRINKDASHVPNLERSENGPDGPWEIVARGIDDLQISYRHGSDEDCGSDCPRWVDDPGAIVTDDYDSLVQRVRVDLSARVVGQPNLAGQTKSVLDVGGKSNVRGRLVTEIAPRAAQAFLATFRHEG